MYNYLYTELTLFHFQVLWAEQQVLQNYKPYSSHGKVIFNDPKWKDQWYMVSNLCYTFWVRYAFSDGSEGAAWYIRNEEAKDSFLHAHCS